MTVGNTGRNDISMNNPISRREFFKSLGKIGLGVVALPPALDALFKFHQSVWAGEPETVKLKEAEYYESLPDGRVKCTLCPYFHIINKDDVCACHTRINKNGKLYTLAYNNPCVLKINHEIEKEPFYHIRPGDKTVTIAFGGCSFRCLYCASWTFSQERPDRLKTKDFPKEKALDTAQQKECKTILFSCAEPTVWPEYIKEATAYVADKGIKSVICTNGFVNNTPLKDLCKNVEGFAVTLKAFDDKVYQKICGEGQKLATVLKSLETIKSEKRWLEIVNIIVPSYTDDMKVIKEMCGWIKKNLGDDVPLHFNRFFPRYKLSNLPPTPMKTIEEARNIGLDMGLKYVYLSNVPDHDCNTTYCPKCKKPVIKRYGFKILENLLNDGKCTCGYQLAGIWK